MTKPHKIIITIVIGLMLAVAAGIVTFLYLQQNTPHQDIPTSSATNKKPRLTGKQFYQAAAKIELGMPQYIVEWVVGQPDICSRKMRDGKYEMQHCGYDIGDPETYFDIVYLNGNVWGMSAVQGSVGQLNSF